MSGAEAHSEEIRSAGGRGEASGRLSRKTSRAQVAVGLVLAVLVTLLGCVSLNDSELVTPLLNASNFDATLGIWWVGWW